MPEDSLASFLWERRPRALPTLLLLGATLVVLAPALAVRVDLSQSANAIVMQAEGAEAVLAAFVEEDQVEELQPGQAAYLRFVAFPPARWGTWRGRVTSIAPTATATGGVPRYKVLIVAGEDAEGPGSGPLPPLRPGMRARADIVIDRQPVWKLVATAARPPGKGRP